MSELRPAAVHFTPAFGAVGENRARLLELTRQAAEQGSRLVVHTELATTGFCLSREQAEEWAEAPDGPTASALGALSRELDLTVVVGLALREGETLSNAQLVLAAGELVAIYRKFHLFGSDNDWAIPGDRAGDVCRIPAGLLGLLVCHDLVYAETWRRLSAIPPAWVAFSTNWISEGDLDPLHWWRLSAQLIGPAPLIAANRGGSERGPAGPVDFSEPSAIYRFVGRPGARKLERWQGAPGCGPELVIMTEPAP